MHVSGKALAVDLAALVVDGAPASHPLVAGHQLRVMAACALADGLAVVASTADGSRYDFGAVVLPGGAYRLCWCAHLAPKLCHGEDAFELEVGTLAVHGPQPTALEACLPDLFVP